MALSEDQVGELEWLWRDTADGGYSPEQRKERIWKLTQILPHHSPPISRDDYDGWWEEKTAPPASMQQQEDNRRQWYHP